MISEKHKKVCKVLNDFEYFHVLISAVSDCVSISAFTSLIYVSVDIAGSAVGTENCPIISRIQKWKLIIKKKNK